MKLKSILKLMDLKTLTAGSMPVVLGTVYAWVRYGRANLLFLLLLVAAMVLIQSSTNMLNDYFDYRRGADADSKSDEKALASGEATPAQLLRLVGGYVTVAFGIGVYLAVRTSPLILLVAGCGALVAILYSSGPLPISYTPFGELASGATMGFGITSTVVYIQSGVLHADALLMAVPTALYIGTIMLTNNLCDMREDAQAKRHTLPIVLGFTAAKRLWIGAVLALPLVTGMLVLQQVYPRTALLTLLLLMHVPALLAVGRAAQLQKRDMMGRIGLIGIQFHLWLIVGLLLEK